MQQLSKRPPGDMVVVSGYEGGFNEVSEVRCVRLKLNQNDKWYYGVHAGVYSANEEADAIAIEIL